MHNLKIWRTVVVAGAMLGVPACGSHDKKPATTPTNTAAPSSDTGATPAPTPTEKPADNANATPPPADPCAGAAMPTPPADDPPPPQDPPKKRPRGGGDRPTGRGFVLA